VCIYQNKSQKANRANTVSMKNKKLIFATLIVSFVNSYAVAKEAENVSLLELSATGVSSIDDSNKHVFLLEERGPKIQVVSKDKLNTAFSNKDKTLPLVSVQLRGFPQAKKDVSWEAITVNREGNQAYLISEDSDLGEYLLYSATITNTNSHVMLTLDSEPIWQGEGKVTEQGRTLRPLNNGGKRDSYNNWNHGFEAMNWFENTNELVVMHESSSIAPTVVQLPSQTALEASLTPHHFRISDLTQLNQNNTQCLLGVSFCWNGDSSEICQSSPNESELNVFAMTKVGSQIEINARSKNLLKALGTNKFNAEGIMFVGDYVYLVNDSSAPKGTKTYLARFNIDGFRKQKDFEHWLEQCSL